MLGAFLHGLGLGAGLITGIVLAAAGVVLIADLIKWVRARRQAATKRRIGLAAARALGNPSDLSQLHDEIRRKHGRSTGASRDPDAYLRDRIVDVPLRSNPLDHTGFPPGSPPPARNS